jgi:hypothetical protein
VSLARKDGNVFYAYQRGAFFNGSSDLEIIGLVLNHSFSIAVWIRPQNGGCLLSINEGKLLELTLFRASSLQVVYKHIYSEAIDVGIE